MTDLELAAYLDRGLSGAELDRVENHLAECAECREQLVETHRVLGRARRPRRIVAAVTVLAAVAAFVLVVKPGQLHSPYPTTSERGGSAAPSLVAYGPSGEVRRTGLRFVWSAAPNAASYHLTISGADGNPIWSTSTQDTTAPAPKTAPFSVGARYFWVVDAILADGRTRSTPVREFSPVP